MKFDNDKETWRADYSSPLSLLFPPINLSRSERYLRNSPDSLRQVFFFVSESFVLFFHAEIFSPEGFEIQLFLSVFIAAMNMKSDVKMTSGRVGS